jgi:hypothetical protein
MNEQKVAEMVLKLKSNLSKQQSSGIISLWRAANKTKLTASEVQFELDKYVSRGEMVKKYVVDHPESKVAVLGPVNTMAEVLGKKVDMFELGRDEKDFVVSEENIRPVYEFYK